MVNKGVKTICRLNFLNTTFSSVISSRVEEKEKKSLLGVMTLDVKLCTLGERMYL